MLSSAYVNNQPTHGLGASAVAASGMINQQQQSQLMGTSEIHSPSELHEMQDFIDASLSEAGTFVYFSKRISVELRLLQEDLSEKVVGSDMLALRVLGCSTPDGRSLSTLRLELTSEVDIFFNYMRILDATSYVDFRREENLNVDFPNFAGQFHQIIDTALANENEKIIFLMEASKPIGNLVFLQNLGHKNMILLNIAFELAPQEAVKQNIMFRYSRINRKLIDRSNKLESINDYIKVKSPELLSLMQKTFSIPINPLQQQQQSTQNHIHKTLPASVLKKQPFH